MQFVGVMCKNIIIKKVASKCRHSIKELLIFVRYDEAKARGSDCDGDDVKNEYLGQTITKEYCLDCKAAREGS